MAVQSWLNGILNVSPEGLLLTEDEYKLAKEDFVKDKDGTDHMEVLSVLLPFALAPFLLAFINNIGRKTPLLKNPRSRFLVEIALVIVPCYAAICVEEAGLGLAAFAVFCCIALSRSVDTPSRSVSNAKPRRVPFITDYRAGILLSTCIAILAVDFNVFPRRFVKCETFGVSLMDVGVGAFVFSAGLTSKQARVVSLPASSFQVRFKAVLRDLLPLLALGFARLWTVRSVNYQEHVSEYGVHWNFFFSLAGVALLSSVFEEVLRLLRQGSAYSVSTLAGSAAAIAVGYQLLLDRGMEAFILEAPRRDLFEANREGILGLLGYLAIFLAGAAIGRFLNSKKTHIHTNTVQFLALLSVVAWAITAASSMHTPISRRMVNAPYVAWTIALNLTMLTVLAMRDTLFHGQRFVYNAEEGRVEVAGRSLHSSSSLILEAINRNGLLVFLAANLLTGAINLSIRTLFVPSAQSHAVLLVYVVVVSIVAVVLMKLWRK